MHIFAFIWRILKCYGHKYDKVDRVMIAIAYLNVSFTSVGLSVWLFYNDESYYSTGLFWSGWGLTVTLLYFFDLNFPKMKIDTGTLNIFSVSKVNLSKVSNNSSTMQFLWIICLVAFAPAIFLGFFFQFIYQAFLLSHTKGLACVTYIDSGYNLNLTSISEGGDTIVYCKLTTSSTNWITVLTNLSACVLLAWAVIRFVAEAILNAENKTKLTPTFAQNIELANAIVSGELNPVIVPDDPVDLDGRHHKFSVAFQTIEEEPVVDTKGQSDAKVQADDKV